MSFIQGGINRIRDGFKSAFKLQLVSKFFISVETWQNDKPTKKEENGFFILFFGFILIKGYITSERMEEYLSNEDGKKISFFQFRNLKRHAIFRNIRHREMMKTNVSDYTRGFLKLLSVF